MGSRSSGQTIVPEYQAFEAFLRFAIFSEMQLMGETVDYVVQEVVLDQVIAEVEIRQSTVELQQDLYLKTVRSLQSIVAEVKLS